MRGEECLCHCRIAHPTFGEQDMPAKHGFGRASQPIFEVWYELSRLQACLSLQVQMDAKYYQLVHLRSLSGPVSSAESEHSVELYHIPPTTCQFVHAFWVCVLGAG